MRRTDSDGADKTGVLRSRSLVLSIAVAWPLSCSPAPLETVDHREQSLVYGDDDRRDLYAVENDELRTLASESTLSLLPSTALKQRADGRFDVCSPTLGELANLCSDQPFASQIAASSCSGVLVDDQLLLTAAHCVDESRRCDNGLWTFGYALLREGDSPSFGEEDLYRCKSVPLRRHDGTEDGKRWDFAFVELDRPVSGIRHPVELRRQPLDAAMALTVVGNPDGLPNKIDSGGAVVDPRTASNDYFILTSDTFGGSSGSAVFDVDERLVGTIVRGGVDYEYRDDAACFAVRRRTAVGLTDAEQASYVGPAIDCLCASGFPSDRLCGDGSGGCPPPGSVDLASTGITHAAARNVGSGCSIAHGAPTRKRAGVTAFAMAVALLGFSTARRLLRIPSLKRDVQSL